MARVMISTNSSRTITLKPQRKIHSLDFTLTYQDRGRISERMTRLPLSMVRKQQEQVSWLHNLWTSLQLRKKKEQSLYQNSDAHQSSKGFLTPLAQTVSNQSN